MRGGEGRGDEGRGGEGRGGGDDSCYSSCSVHMQLLLISASLI